MTEPTALIEKFYSSFQQKDWKGMQACYHDGVLFSDPVFRDLKGKEAKAMWHMLNAAAKDLTISYKNIRVSSGQGSCDWEALYPFSRTGRKVHNIIQAQFEFQDGLIIRHTDHFNLWRWSGMALGLSGTFLGWTPMVQSKIRQMAEKNLKKFIQDHAEYRA